MSRDLRVCFEYLLLSARASMAYRPSSSTNAPMISAPIRLWTWVDTLLALSLFVSSLLLYTITLAPTITTASSDSPELILKAAQGAVAHSPGSPSYIWLGHLFAWLP